MVTQTATVFFMVLLSNGCDHYKSSQTIQGIEVRSYSSVMDETFYRVFYMDTLMIYQRQYQFDSTFKRLRIDSVANRIYSEDTLLLSQWRNMFFVFHKDSGYGYSYDSRGFYSKIRREVGSEITFTVGTNKFDSFLTVKPDSIMWNTLQTQLKEVFFIPKTKDGPDAHVNFYYSDKLNHLRFSFNRTVDSVKKMKLYKTEIIFDEFYDEKNKKYWPSSVDWTEMREINVDKKELMPYVNVYRQSIKK